MKSCVFTVLITAAFTHTAIGLVHSAAAAQSPSSLSLEMRLARAHPFDIRQVRPAQQREKPVLALSCVADKSVVAPGQTVNLIVSIENRGASEVYLYRTLEWGWAGIGYELTDERGIVMHAQKHAIPPPPPPVSDKSQLVGLAPGYFFGTHLVFDLSHYQLTPGTYFIEVSYQSNYGKDAGFGLPLLLFDDGEFRSNKVRIELRPK